MSDNQNIINLEDGWNNEIKCKAIEPLEVSLQNHILTVYPTLVFYSYTYEILV